ncbi:prepilin-type N-terminal cleavage/methylation domain-containing protein [Verrucomicrobiota bacterium]
MRRDKGEHSTPLFRRSIAPIALTSFRQTGFTLIEVLVTIVILSVGIVTVLQALDASVCHLGISRDTMLATMLMKEKMADLETQTFNKGEINTGLSRGRFQRSYRDFLWQLHVKRISGLTDIQTVADGTSCSLNEVSLTVWREDSKRKYSITTYIRTSKGQ